MDAVEEHDEAALIERVVGGDQDAFAELVKRHQAHVRAYLGSHIPNRVAVDDLAQEVFITMHRGLAKYDGSVPLIAWLIGIARHRKLAYLRTEARRLTREGGDIESALAGWRLDAASEPENCERTALQLETLERCMEKLAEHQNRLVKAHYYEGTGLDTLARELGRTCGAVRVALMRVREALRKCVEAKAV